MVYDDNKTLLPVPETDNLICRHISSKFKWKIYIWDIFDHDLQIYIQYNILNSKLKKSLYIVYLTPLLKSCALPKIEK